MKKNTDEKEFYPIGSRFTVDGTYYHLKKSNNEYSDGKLKDKTTIFVQWPNDDITSHIIRVKRYYVFSDHYYSDGGNWKTWKYFPYIEIYPYLGAKLEVRLDKIEGIKIRFA